MSVVERSDIPIFNNANVGLAESAFTLRYTPLAGNPGKPEVVPPIPATPLVVETNTVFASVGWTKTSLIARPVNMSAFDAFLLSGPVRSAVVRALLIRYKPTPT
jgi:hypothetical protein